MYSWIITGIFTFTAFLGRVSIGYNGYSGGSMSSTLETFHQHVCDKEDMTIKCPHKTIISIQFAQYGRQVPSSLMCPVPAKEEHTYYRYGYYSDRTVPKEDTKCQATTSLQVLLDLCQNRHTCHLVASTRTFGQDPCPGTSKYLEVAYKCQPDEYKNEVVCEGGQMVLWCKRSTRVAIYSAMFGHSPNGSSQCETLESQPSLVDCQARNTVEAVRKQCHGRKQCAVEAEEYMFGDPCGEGINKYLNVTYTCVPKKVFKASHRKERRKHHRKKKNRKKQHRKDHKKSLKSSSTEAEIFTKFIIATTTPTFRTFIKTVTPKPEQASADAADSETTEHNISKSGDPIKKEDTSSKEDRAEEETTASSTVNLTVLCVNYTTVPVGKQKDKSMGLLIDWFNTVDFINKNLEKVVLYLALGVCIGVIILLTIILIKIGRDYKRNTRAKLDVTDPTHCHAVTSNHHPLEGSLERAESIDRIEVVRFSPRGTLRHEGTRSLSNYYG